MKRIYIALIMGIATITASAQTDNGQEMQYRRSSIYSILINHIDQKFANDIKKAFLQIPVPDKYNDHDLSVKVLSLNEKLKGAKKDDENPLISEFLTNNKVASRLVGRWFNRDAYTGACNMDLVKERGLYNATEFDRQLALHSARGMAMLQDAGEELIGNTFVLVNDIRYVDKSKGSKIFGSILKVAGGMASILTGDDSYANMAESMGNIAESYKGFKVRINTFLYRLDWNTEQANLFYQDQYGDGQDAQKKMNFDMARGNYRLRYVGKVESNGGSTSFLGIKEDEPLMMVRKACQRAIDENVVDLQREFE